MRSRLPSAVVPFAAAVALAVLSAGFALRAQAAPVAPANFAVSDAVPGAGFSVLTGIAFLPDGRFFVAEKEGQVWEVRNGVKRPTPIWSGQYEVLDEGDRGLLGIAVDPNYYANHYLYLLYAVDADSNNVDNNVNGFGRLTRYTVNFTDSTAVIPASRTILIGTSWPTGMLEVWSSHSVGSLRFGSDGSLLVSHGEGAHFEYMDDGGNDPTAFGTGKGNPNDDIGAYRAQDITNMNGKVMRINPANGHGYASNPFANSNLASPQSRVYAYGMRNPFRFTVRPGTGAADTTGGNPGVLFIGDVGYNTWEEMDVATSGGSNFGWPCYEGLNAEASYQAGSPAHNGCGSFGTATNPSQRRSPLATWPHSGSLTSTPPGLAGNCSVGGTFYTGNQYPAQYRNQYIFGDYGADWIKLATLDVNNNLISISNFISTADAPVDFATNPVGGDVYYVSIGANQVRRIRYTGASNGNTPPVAAIAATPLTGQAPLSVAFSSAGSTDPNGDPMTYTWVYTDGSGDTQPNPTHVFTVPGVFNVQLTVSDNRGGSDIKYITVTVSAPVIPFPTTPVLDNFNRANGAPGPNWVDQTVGYQIVNNALVPLNTTAYMEWGAKTFGANQEVYVKFNAVSASATEQNLMLKTQGATWTAGHVEVSYNAPTSSVTVGTLNSGTWSTAGTIPGITFKAGDVFGARALGNGLVQVFRNSVLIGQYAVTYWPYFANGGAIGLSNEAATATQWDDFGGGNVVSNLNTPPVATIVSPLNNTFYYAGQTINLTGTATDGQSPMDSLTFNWMVDLYHNNHIHPATYVATGPNTSIIGANHDDGTGVHLMVKLTVKDPAGAVSDTVRAAIWPEIDLTSSAVTVSPDPPQVGQIAHFTFALVNSGRMPAPISHWVLRAGSTIVAQGDTIVPATGSAALTADAALPTAGTFALRLTADSLNAVYETNESNNSSVRSFTVTPLPGNHPPVANAVGLPQSGTIPLTVSFSGATSTDADNDSLTFGWAFGDGGTANGRLASHTYAAAASYAAILTVTDGHGGSDTASVAISASPPVTAFPQNLVLDNFNRANGAPGTNWQDQTTAFSIATNTIGPNKTGDVYVEWAPTSFGPAQEVFATLSAISASSPEQNLMLKTQGATWTSGHIEVSYNPIASQVDVATFTPPSTWKTWGSLTGVTFAAGNQFGARALSNGTVQVYKNGALLGSVSVSGWAYSALGGRIGLSAFNATALRFDNFGGGNVVTNTKPVVTVSSPANNSFYYTGSTINLSGSATDVETPAGPFTYNWIVDLAFGSHVSPAFATYPGASASYLGADYDDGTGVHQNIEFTAADPGGAVSDTGRVTIWPEIDLAPSAVTVTPDPPTAGQSAHYTFALTNGGRMPAQASRWALRAGSTLLAQGNAAVTANGTTNLAADAVLPAAGNLTLRLTADSLAAVFETNEANNVSLRALTVSPAPNVPPVAIAVAVPVSGPAPLVVTFSGATSSDANGDSLTYAWDFGDGGTATVRRLAHTYAAQGEYAALLTVNDGHGGSDTASVAISVAAPANVPPVANAVGLPKSGTIPLTVNFSGATSTDSNGDSLTFGWTFGDGGTATGRLASHTYSTAGSYAAILTVNDGHSGTDTASVAISATPPLGTFPATAVLDNFNRANGAPGANWQDLTTRYSIASNRLAPQTGETYLEWAPASFGPNQEAFVTFGTMSAIGIEQNLSLKTQGATWTAGHLEVSYSASASRVDVATFTPPSTWKTWGSIAGVSFASGNQFGARALSDGTVQVYKNGTLAGTVSIAGWPYAANGGRIGVSTYNSSGTRFDNFGGGTMPAALVTTGPTVPAAQRRYDGAPLPADVSLSGAFPNPTNGGVELSLALPREAEVSMSVLDIQGREVWSTGIDHRAAGRWTLAWDGRATRGPANTGVYLARIRVGSQVLLRRFAIIR